jgi:hypothetical protein
MWLWELLVEIVICRVATAEDNVTQAWKDLQEYNIK